jgi:thiaminase/transcriptional activator TenA
MASVRHDSRMSGFTAQAWEHTARLQEAMLELPFNAELAAGTLGLERFQFYLVQDARYLLGFARALAAAASREPTEADVQFFARAADEAISGERELHAGYFASFGLDDAAIAEVPTAPTTAAYTDFLLARSMTGGYAELVAALLPCFWVYHHVGTEIHARQVEGSANPFRAWIETYADEEFAATVRDARAAVDAAAESADERTRERMLAAFTRAVEHEWMFWDGAYRMARWPTAELRP